VVVADGDGKRIEALKLGWADEEDDHVQAVLAAGFAGDPEAGRELAMPAVRVELGCDCRGIG
jgi:hypothetical protein